MGVNDSNLWRVGRRDFLVFSAGLVTAMSLGGCATSGGSVKFRDQPWSGHEVPRRNM
jgi:hypothetical protein